MQKFGGKTFQGKEMTFTKVTWHGYVPEDWQAHRVSLKRKREAESGGTPRGS